MVARRAGRITLSASGTCLASPSSLGCDRHAWNRDAALMLAIMRITPGSPVPDTLVMILHNDVAVGGD